MPTRIPCLRSSLLSKLVAFTDNKIVVLIVCCAHLSACCCATRIFWGVPIPDVAFFRWGGRGVVLFFGCRVPYWLAFDKFGPNAFQLLNKVTRQLCAPHSLFRRCFIFFYCFFRVYLFMGVLLYSFWFLICDDGLK